MKSLSCENLLFRSVSLEGVSLSWDGKSIEFRSRAESPEWEAARSRQGDARHRAQTRTAAVTRRGFCRACLSNGVLDRAPMSAVYASAVRRVAFRAGRKESANTNNRRESPRRPEQAVLLPLSSNPYELFRRISLVLGSSTAQRGYARMGPQQLPLEDGGDRWCLTAPGTVACSQDDAAPVSRTHRTAASARNGF
jgi:hypothetical protein